MSLAAVPQDAEAALAAERTRQLQAAAQPLVALALQLRRASLDLPAGVLRALMAAIERFEKELAAQGFAERDITAASYALCSWVDELVAELPWGAAAESLLQRFHREEAGRTRVLRLLAKLAEEPQRHRPLLHLFHACLSLGLQGELRGSAQAQSELRQLRQRVYESLQGPGAAAAPLSAADARQPHQRLALSPDWPPAVRPPSPRWKRQAWLAALLLGGLLSLACYTAAHFRLASQVDAVFLPMQRLQAPGQPAAASPAKAARTPSEGPTPARLAAALADDVRAGRLLLHEEAQRSTVSVAADRLMAAGGAAALSEEGRALLQRIAAALSPQPGKVVVIGHTDGRDARSARLPSAWHQSYEWARLAAGVIDQGLGGQRVSAEGAADQQGQPVAGAAAGPRRVDIVLYP